MANMLHMQGEGSIWQRLGYITWGLVFLICVLASVGFTALYSAAGGNLDPWASRQIPRFIVFLAGMIVIALIDIRVWYKVAYPFYFACLFLLLVVDITGHIGMGAQRWIKIGFIQIQPSELMKIAVVMALARYFHSAEPEDMKNLRFLFVGLIFLIAPFLLVAAQPDLGTSGVIVMAGIAMFFLAGAPMWIFILGAVGAMCAAPMGWLLLHDYQKQRVLTFLDPERDPLGAGYHITQSKIALGSGGIEGKGFLKGTQSHLNFLPEKQTDFIFTLWVEEWGLFGGIFILFLVASILAYGAWIAMKCRHSFGRLMAFGLMVNFSIYIFINVSMVMGLIPVVGVPFPMLSYGGTAMMTVIIGFGLMMSCNVYRDAKLPRM
ncbi:MAG: rod shape-determining protein RodA [Micavibrio aeruginosavorus]|uniref:Peptidoglycan glycosyltransferase RodA n=1 Tax=Micavibrio aeruginosavorus TaxID=349221 RepID=A0A2W5Q1T0_9BACT|nr:MAG: rod shape-determining protein RodA [Micavibrio aeruginosavorus]